MLFSIFCGLIPNDELKTVPHVEHRGNRFERIFCFSKFWDQRRWENSESAYKVKIQHNKTQTKMIDWYRLWYAKGNLPVKIPSKVMRAEGRKVESKYLMRWNLSPRTCIMYIQVNAWPLTFQGSNCRKLDKVGANADNKYGNINQLAVIHFWWPLHFGCRPFRFI